MARLLVRYGIEGTRVWGVFDDEVLAGVLCLSRRLGHEPSDAASLWGAYVLPRYRGTFVYRALMGAVMGWCDREPRIRSIVAQLTRGNVYARDYRARSGFCYCEDESAPGLENGRAACREDVCPEVKIRV